MIDIQLLGTLRATACGTSIAPSARKERRVLALLALNPGQLVTFPMLIEEIWGDRPPGVPLASLHTYILHLRQRLQPALARDGLRTPKDVLITGVGGYALDVPPDDVDAGRYERLVAAGRQATIHGDYATAARTLAAAMAEWRGRALVDVDLGPQLEVERTRLEESRLCTLDLRIDADLRLGRHRLLLDELATLCGRHPWFENFHAQHMLALQRSGLRSRALAVYRRLYDSMGRHLGVDPSWHLRQLHQAILAGDPVVDQPGFAISDWTASYSG
jgi:DNA-binding SARP family transcriptional activator